MANTLGAYSPIFYAQETLRVMMEMYGMINRVNRTFSDERKAFNKGEYISIRRPAAMTTQAGGNGTITDLVTETVQIQLDGYREVKFAVTDKDYSFTGDELVRDHIRPAAYALAEYVNTAITAEHKNIPWYSPWTSTIVASDVAAGMKVLKDAGSGISGDSANIHMGIDTTVDAALQGLSEFNAANIAGNTNTALVNGMNPGRFGVGDFFVDQTFTSFTSGTIVSAATDLVGALSADVALGATSFPMDSLAAAETVVAGDTFIVAGSSQRYAITAANTLSSNAMTVVATPPAAIAYTSADVVTFETKATAYADAYEPNLLFHRDAFALVTAPLPDDSNFLANLGVDVFTATDPISGLSVRARRAYVDGTAKVAITLDVLYGIKTLNPNYAVVMRRNTP